MNVRATEIKGTPLMATVGGLLFTTGTVTTRRMECRRCLRKFYPYRCEPDGSSVRVNGLPVLVAGAFDACPGCGIKWTGDGQANVVFVGMKVHPGSGTCDAACVRATSSDCRCSCHGANHGALA